MTKRVPKGASFADLARARLADKHGITPRQLSAEEKAQAVHASLNVPNPADNSARLAIDTESLIQLRVTDIDPYDRNPRQAPNERFAEIKESIRTTLIQTPLVVTKRPGSSRYMISAGGNSRLKAIQELFAETGNARFEQVLATYRPWQGESMTLAAHLVENEVRGGMTFWDRAQGLWSLKDELEKEQEKPLSLREFSRVLKEHGLNIAMSHLSYCGFALENLRELEDATAWLTRNVRARLKLTMVAR